MTSDQCVLSALSHSEDVTGESQSFQPQMAKKKHHPKQKPKHLHIPYASIHLYFIYPSIPHPNVQKQICPHTYIIHHTYIQSYIHTYIDLDIDIDIEIDIDIHTHIHTYIYTYIHTYMT